MNCALNMHHLVGLMSVAIGSHAHHTSRWNDILLDKVIGGLLVEDKGKECTITILD